ncbi:Hypothetical_protein [Hexamita inflata]|uniref:Hypothetical_protein n=1 Tax=Hexamita inflata TaxID=28002 RepID=A0AA86URV4_9EUKA|nr:Hypothetical protein HINF_LOCUS56880 [Hexamita inflata]
MKFKTYFRSQTLKIEEEKFGRLLCGNSTSNHPYRFLTKSGNASLNGLQLKRVPAITFTYFQTSGVIHEIQTQLSQNLIQNKCTPQMNLQTSIVDFANNLVQCSTRRRIRSTIDPPIQKQLSGQLENATQLYMIRSKELAWQLQTNQMQLVFVI